jgi:hypothetical protein
MSENTEGKWRWSKREETGHITDIVRSGKLGITAATPDYLNELEDCKRRLAVAEGKAALADEAMHYCEYSRPFSNEDNPFWDYWQERYDALTAPSSDTGSEEANDVSSPA